MRRLAFIDVARGIAVILMVYIHCFNSWVDPARRDTTAYHVAQHLGGFAAPGFLLLAGVGLGFKFDSARRRGQTLQQTRRSALKRGGQILLLAYVFRFQEWLLAGAKGAVVQLLKVDVLNCIGAALILTALLGPGTGAWKRLSSELPKPRPWPSFRWAMLLALATPLIWQLPFPLGLWQALTGYIGGDPQWSAFPLFPWAAYALAGFGVGLLWSAAAARGGEALGPAVFKVTTWSLAFGLAGRGLHVLLVPYVGDAASANLGWTSPARFAYRLGISLALTGSLYAFERAKVVPLWETVRRMGQASLLIYWVHVDLVYGRLSGPLHGRLTLIQTGLGLLLLLAAMAMLAWARTSGYLKLPSWFSLRTASRAAGPGRGA